MSRDLRARPDSAATPTGKLDTLKLLAKDAFIQGSAKQGPLEQRVGRQSEKVSDAEFFRTGSSGVTRVAPDTARSAFEGKHGIVLPTEVGKALDQKIKTLPTKGRGKAGETTLGDLVAKVHSDLANLRGLQRRYNADPASLTAAESKQMEDLVEEYLAEKTRGPFSGLPDNIGTPEFTDEVLMRIASNNIRRHLEFDGGLRNAAGVRTKLGGGQKNAVMRFVDSYLDFRRTMALYNVARGPAYVGMQAVGNALSLAIADPVALGYYMFKSPEIFKEMKRGKLAQFGDGYIPVETTVDAKRRMVGRGRSETLTDVNRDELGSGTAFQKLIATGREQGGAKGTVKLVGGKIGDTVVAPHIFRDFANGFDTHIRESIWDAHFTRRYTIGKREIENHALNMVGKAQRGTGLMIPLTDADITDVFRSMNARNGGYYSANDLRKALMDKIDPANPNAGQARNVADRIARDWATAIKTMDDEAKKEVDRVAFSFENTRADEVLRRVFMFHYWTSRASKLYLTEAIKKPYLASAYFRAMDQLEREAEKGNVPERMKGFIKFLNSPGGYMVALDPVALISSWATFTDWAPPEPNKTLPDGSRPATPSLWDKFWGVSNPNKDLTEVGEFMNGGFGSNLMMNPLAQMLVAAADSLVPTRVLGPDTRTPDLLGSSGWERSAMDILQMANAYGVLPISKDAEGNPMPIPEVNTSNALRRGIIAIQAGAQRAGLGQLPINDTASSYDYLLRDFDAALIDTAAQMMPGATRKQIVDAAELAAGDPGSAIYQSALRSVARRGVVEAGLRGLSPLRTQTEGLSNLASQEDTGQPGMNAPEQVKKLGLEKAVPTTKEEAWDRNNMINRSPESEAAKALIDGYYGSSDPRGKEYRATKDAIEAGTITTPIMIDGYQITPEQIAALSPETRKKVASAWVSGQPDGWKALNGGGPQQEAYLKEHPEVKNYLGFKAAAENYGNPVEFVTLLASENPDYARYMAEVEKTKPRGSEEWADAGITSDAFYALTGGQPDIWDNKGTENDLTPYVPGLDYGQTLSRYYDEQGQQTEEGKRGLVADVQADLQRVGQIKNYLDGLDPSGGYWQMFLAQSNGAKGKAVQFPSSVYNYLKDNFSSEYGFKASGYALDYLNAAEQAVASGQPVPDFFAFTQTTSDEATIAKAIEAVQTELGGNAPVQQAAAIPENPAEFDPATLWGQQSASFAPAPAAPAPLPAPTNAQEAAAIQNAPMTQGEQVATFGLTAVSSTPGGPRSVSVAANQTLVVLGRQGEWVLVDIPGYGQGWVPAASLKKVPR